MMLVIIIIIMKKTISNFLFYLGQLYGLEKFWAFLKYSRQKPKINPKLEEILKKFQRLEDFRVDGASFPQQFYPTKSGIKVNRANTTIFYIILSFSDCSTTGSSCCSKEQ